MPTMVFHAAYPFNPDSVSASSIRPIRMFQAFRELGFHIIEVNGYAKERKAKFVELKRFVEGGGKVDFLYSESSTIPPSITERKHLPPHFFLDDQIFRFCHRHGIPAGVFYRDIYWKFPDYVERVGRPLATAMRVLYKAELRSYMRSCSRVFLPSLPMARYLPELSGTPVSALPPGGEIKDQPASQPGVSILYVGGLGVHYRLHNLVAAVAQVQGVHLTICAEKSRWEGVCEEYPQIPHERITIAHASGAALDELYQQATICSVAVEPLPYWTFASPVKLYEYIGRGKPLIATEGTLPAKVVSGAEIGWTTDNSVSGLVAMLTQLRDNPTEIQRATRACLAIRSQHSWQSRARQVASELMTNKER